MQWMHVQRMSGCCAHAPGQVAFKYVDDLATVWCEWAEMELRHKNFKRALDICRRATYTPDKYNRREVRWPPCCSLTLGRHLPWHMTSSGPGKPHLLFDVAATIVDLQPKKLHLPLSCALHRPAHMCKLPHD